MATINTDGNPVNTFTVNISSTATTSTSLDSTSNTIQPNTISPSQAVTSPRSGAGACNESEKHDNDEKALFHSLKGAWRMSREYDGREYGSENPQYEPAARMAANAGIAFLRAKEKEYDREESLEYLRENVVADRRVIDRVKSLLGIEETSIDAGDLSRDDLEDGLDRAWTQVDDKRKHADAARTAIATAEGYLGEAIWEDA